MTAYLLLSIAVLVPALVIGVVLLLLVASGRRSRVLAACAVTLVVLLGMTAVFDSIIVGTRIVAYDEGRILGLRIGTAPIEDFAYPIAAAVVLPALWLAMTRPRRRTR